MGKAITVSIKLTQAELKKAIESAGLKITDRAAFGALLDNPEFQQKLAADIKQVWELTNDEEDGENLAMLFGDVVEFDDEY